MHESSPHPGEAQLQEKNCIKTV